jgi:hypothetical protein
MRFTALTFAGLLAASGAQAQTIGVAVCDEFVTKYEACVGSKVPAAQRSAFKGMIDQMKGVWAEAAKDEGSKGDLEAMCKQTAEQANASLKSHGCAF